MCQPKRCWPTRAEFGVVPDGELKKVKVTLAVNSTPTEDEKDIFAEPWLDLTRYSTLHKARNIMYRILKFVDSLGSEESSVKVKLLQPSSEFQHML